MPARIRAEWGSDRERSELEDEQRDSTSPLADVNSSGGPVRARSFATVIISFAVSALVRAAT